MSIEIRSGNQLIGKTRPKWSDPLGDKLDSHEEKKNSGVSKQMIGQLKSFLDTEKNKTLTDEKCKKVKEMINDLYTTDNGKSKPGTTFQGHGQLSKNPSKNGKTGQEKLKRDPAPEDFDGQWKLKCFYCPETSNPHEFGRCEQAMKAGNKQRYQRAVYLALCLACLRRDCRIEK